MIEQVVDQCLELRRGVMLAEEPLDSLQSRSKLWVSSTTARRLICGA
ncbi:MAG: hypothetical protein IPL61_30840 [Myxococcales bacterium]|nr:hypothetical protein [Myxococcales bacterium]